MISTQKGISLIELILVIIIIGIIGTGLFTTLSLSFRETPREMQRFQALLFAQKQMEFFIAQKQILGFQSIGQFCHRFSQSPLCIQPPSGYQIESIIQTENDSEKSITIIVRQLSDDSILTSLKTVLTDYP